MIDEAIFQVEDVFSISGRGIVVAGQLIQGVVRKGMKGIINGKQTEILAIESRNTSLESLTVGMPAGLLLSNIEKDDIEKGHTYHFQ